METNKPENQQWHPARLYREVKKKSTKVEQSTSLLLRNLIKTNKQLLRTLDVSSSVLF